MTTALDPHAVPDTRQQALAALTLLIARRPPADRLLAEMVRHIETALHAAGAAVFLSDNPDHPDLFIEHHLAPLGLTVNAEPLPGFVSAVRRTVREAKPLVVPAFFADSESSGLPVNPTPHELLFIPMRLQGKVALILALALPPAADAAGHHGHIQFIQRMLSAVEASLTDRHLRLVEKDRGANGQLVTFAEQVHKHLLTAQVAADIANLSRDLLGAQRVTVQLYARRRKIAAVSNVDEPNKRSVLFLAHRLVLDYVHERNTPILLDRAAASRIATDTTLQDAASACFAASGFAALAATPIRHGDTVVGVILAEFATADKATPQMAPLADLARVSATAVANAIEFESIPMRWLLHGAVKLWRHPTSTRRTVISAVTAIILAAVLVLGFVPFDFAIKADCALQPRAQLGIVAPDDGRIIDVPVHAGETVYARNDQPRPGDKVRPLAIFDTTDLLASRAEQQQKEAEIAVQLKDLQSRGELSRIGSAQLQLKQVQEQIKSLNDRIDRATVYSPIRGTVLTENVEQKKWASVRLGEPLMEVASFDDWVLVLDIPESEVATVRNALELASRRAMENGTADPGIEVEYIFYPWPDKRYSIRAHGVASILPASSQSKSANVFRLQLQVNPADLPPGIAMSGVTGRAKLHLGKQPLFNQWTRGLKRLLEMTAFF